MVLLFMLMLLEAEGDITAFLQNLSFLPKMVYLPDDRTISPMELKPHGSITLAKLYCKRSFTSTLLVITKGIYVFWRGPSRMVWRDPSKTNIFMALQSSEIAEWNLFMALHLSKIAKWNHQGLSPKKIEVSRLIC